MYWINALWLTFCYEDSKEKFAMKLQAALILAYTTNCFIPVPVLDSNGIEDRVFTIKCFQLLLITLSLSDSK